MAMKLASPALKFRMRPAVLLAAILSCAATAVATAADNAKSTFRAPVSAAPSKPTGISAAAWDSILQQVQRELYSATTD